MTTTGLTCDRCGAALWAGPAAGEWFTCGGCGRPTRVEAFPRLVRAKAGPREAAVAVGAEAACFYHDGRQAAVACDHCGRFLCAVCDVEVHGRHLCPACLESGRREQRADLGTKATRYDVLALFLVLAPVLFLFTAFLTVFTAPAAVAVVIWGWRRQRSLVSRGRAGMAVALVLALLEIAGVSAALVMLWVDL